jgi:hypothetical protein
MPAVTNTNYNKFVNSQSDAGRELVVSGSKTNMVHADILAVYRQLTVAAGSSGDAATVAAFGTANGSAFESGVTDVVYFRVQTTGTPNLTEVSGVTLATVAIFQPAL